MDRIETEEQYEKVMARIESYLQKVTKAGSFDALTTDEADELARLSLLAETWEDSIPLMPIPVRARTRVADSRQ